MAKKANEERSKEMTILRERILPILEALRRHFPPEVWALFEAGLNKAYEAADLKGLRLMAREMEDIAMALPPAEQASLNDLLLTKFGRGLREVAIEEQRDVKRILKRGAIGDDDEFRLLRDQLDDADKRERLSPADIQLINKLLRAYESAK